MRGIELFKQIAKSMIPVLAAIAAATLFCGFILIIQDFDADTGPIVARGLLCLFAEFTSLGIGSFVAARRADDQPFRVASVAGSIGAFILVAYLGWVLWSEGRGEKGETVALLVAETGIMFGIGVTFSFIGAWTGSSTRRTPSDLD
jgi:hypothetical protein